MSAFHPLASLPSIGERRPLRILFVSSTTSGGSGKSQRELDKLVRASGAETMMLVDTASGSTLTRFLHEQLWDASVRFADTPLLGESASWLRSIPGRRANRRTATGSDPQAPLVLETPAPENALPDIAVSFRPDIVIGSSIARATWRTIQQTCSDLHIPTALYMREATATGHLSPRQGHPFHEDDLLLANSHTLVAAARDFGRLAHFVPSVVDLDRAAVDSTRERILLINPRREHGVELIQQLAAQFRTIEFVLQESWQLKTKERHLVDSILARHPNVSFRARTDSPAEVYRDAAIVLAPHRMDNRPRIILEALSNGIPVIASDLPGLVESVGDGGMIAARPSEWFDAITKLWQDPVTYRRYQHAAYAHAGRIEVLPENIVTEFLGHVHAAVTHRRDRPIDLDAL